MLTYSEINSNSGPGVYFVAPEQRITTCNTDFLLSGKLLIPNAEREKPIHINLHKLMKDNELNQKEIANLKRQNQEMKMTLDDLITHIHYMPGGIGFDEAKQHFEEAQISLSAII